MSIHPRTACSTCGADHRPDDPCARASGARVGSVIEGKYELVRLIGEGGMGQVYEGRHRVIGRRVAVKFLLPEYARDSTLATRFENEARAAGGIEHENIGAVFDVGALEDRTKYLVMEFLDGEDVDGLVKREAPLPSGRAAAIVIQACRGLDVVHQRGIIHRDLKPANLFLTKRADKTDLVKVLDFGIAKLRDGDGHTGTQTGAAIGTAYYMSPEQARGERGIDARTDIYSLGVILYELVSGRKPHDGETLLAILHQVMTRAPVDLATIQPGLPDGFYDVVRRAMAAEPSNRYESVADLGDALLPFTGRALPPIRSQPGAFAPREAIGSPTGIAVSSTRPGLSGSVAGVVRSDGDDDPPVIPVRRAGPLLGGAVVVGVVALFAVIYARGSDAGGSSASQTSATIPTSDPPSTPSAVPLPNPVAVAASSTSPPPLPTAVPASVPTPGHRGGRPPRPAPSQPGSPAHPPETAPRAMPTDRGANPF